jgi:cytochrome c oxidase assembly protein subunit 11
MPTTTTVESPGSSVRAIWLRRANLDMVGKLTVVVALMFGFGYAMVPMYKSICKALGINVLSLTEQQAPGALASSKLNTQVDLGRSITIEFDANARGPWDFKSEVRTVRVHPGEITTVMYEFRNRQDRTIVFVIDPKLPKDVTTITLSYTFFEVGGKVPMAPGGSV